MTAKKGQGVKWRQTTMLLRADILTKAQSAGVDINEVCNRALADVTGIRYAQQKPADTAPAAPVIIAHDSTSAGGRPLLPTVPPAGIHPVINADDPRAAITVKQVLRPPVPRTPEALPGQVASPAKRSPDSSAPAEKPKKTETRPEKKGKGSAIKKFVREAIVREDADESHVSKDVLYQAFSRWCREHRIVLVPDRKAVTVALKNQFALKEKTVGGEPSWVNIRLR